VSTSHFGENWFPPGAEPVPVIKGYIVEYDNMGDLCASYAIEGLLCVPCVEVSDPSGGLQTYRIELHQQSPYWSFDLDLSRISPVSVNGTFCARYEAEGVLHIPCVEVSDPSGGFSAYRIELQQQFPSWSFELDLNSIVPITP